jgi:hypothetical protein
MGDIKKPTNFIKSDEILKGMAWVVTELNNLGAFIRLSPELTAYEKERSKASVKRLIKELEAVHVYMGSDT